MGIDYDGKLLVGLDYEDVDLSLLPDYNEEDEQECLYKNNIATASPYFDAPIEDCTIGIELGDLPLDTDEYITAIENAKSRFIELFGVTPKLIGTQNIW
jgi:hypothetical protein